MPSNLSRRWHYLLLTVVSLVLAVAWAVPSTADLSRSFPRDEIQPYQLTHLTIADEQALGRAIDTALKQDGLTIYHSDPSITAYIRQIGQRLGEASQIPMPFTFQVVDNDDANAFATVGGYIYIYTGLLRKIRNETELAGVLAHEMAHIQQRDGLNQLWLQLTTLQLVELAPSLQEPLIFWGGHLRSIANSHEDEFTADALAFRWLGQVGYNPAGMLTLLNRLSNDGADSSAPALISTHPAAQRRLARLRQLRATVIMTGATDGQHEALYRSRMDSILAPEANL